MNDTLRNHLRRTQWMALAVGLIGASISIAGWRREPTQFFFSYLYSIVFWLGLSLGCLAVAMIHQLAGGRWGYPTRRFLEAGSMTLPLMLLLFVPLFFGLHHLYPWARPDEVGAEKTLQELQPYNNQRAFIIRQILFFLVWIVMAVCLRGWSLQQDKTDDAAPTRKARALSGAGVVIYGLVGTFASVDWIMSLETHWHSSVFGVIVLIGQILTAFAFVAVMLALFQKQPPFSTTVTKVHYHHLGNLLLTFVLFWTYVSFGQLLIVYSGDLPSELNWYLHRITGSWKIIVAAIAIFHFFLPFLLLLFRAVKRREAVLGTLAAMLFVMHLVDTYWLVMPTLHPNGISLDWLDFVVPIGVGGLWVSAFLWRLGAAPLLPQRDPGMQFSFAYVRS